MKVRNKLMGAGCAVIALMTTGGVYAGQGCSSITDYSSAWASPATPETMDLTEVKMPWRISLDYSYNNANQLILGRNRQNAVTDKYSETYTPGNPGTGLGVRNRYEELIAGVSYDYSQIITVGMSLPYVKNQRWEDHMNYSHYTGEGNGDIIAFGKYWIKKEKDAFNTYAELGLSLPTGTSNEQFSYPTVGPVTLTPAQAAVRYKAGYIEPGLGQWEPIIALGFEKTVSERTSLYGRTQYSDPLGTNNAGYKSQSNLVTNLGVAYTFEKRNNQTFGVTGQFNWVFAQFRKDQRNGVDVANTGGNWVDFQPGAFYSPNGGITTFTASLPIGIYYDANSIQTYAPWSLKIGMSQRF